MWNGMSDSSANALIWWFETGGSSVSSKIHSSSNFFSVRMTFLHLKQAHQQNIILSRFIDCRQTAKYRFFLFCLMCNVHHKIVCWDYLICSFRIILFSCHFVGIVCHGINFRDFFSLLCFHIHRQNENSIKTTLTKKS